MPIDKPLRDQRAQPRGQAAAAVKVTKDGLADAVLFLEAKQLGVERLRDLARGAAGIDRIRRAIHCRPEFTDEMIPRVLAAHRARAGQREVVEMQRLVITIE